MSTIEEQVESLHDDGAVNVAKLYQLHSVVKELRAHQLVGYEWKSCTDLNRYLLNMVTITEQEALAQSIKLEPRVFD